MIKITLKAVDERQSLTHAEGYIGKLKWVASFFGRAWCVTIPAGCDNAAQVIATVRERLIEVYPEG